MFYPQKLKAQIYNKTKMLRFLQVNLNRCRTAQDLLAQGAHEKKIDVIILSEPNKAITDENIWVTDTQKE